MPRVRINDLHFHYELQGKGHPLVLISGYTCDHYVWESVREMLAEHFQLLLFDNRAAGQSEYPHAPFTIEQMASDTMGLIDHLGLQHPHVIGHSMGSAIAQTLAHRHGAKLGKIVLAASFAKLNAVCMASLNFFYHLRLDGVHPARLIEGILPWLSSSSFMADSKNVAQAIDMRLHAPYPQSEIGQKYQLEALSHFDSRSWIKKITSPMLAISGEADILCPPRELHHFVQDMPNMKFVTIPEMSHTFHLERPQEFVRLVLDFLK